MHCPPGSGGVSSSSPPEFRGLPTPAATLVCVSLGLLSEQTAFAMPAWGVPLTAAVLAGLMVSPLPMFSLKFRGFGWPGNELRYLFLLVAAAMIPLLQLYALPAIVALYVLLSAGRALRKRCAK